jgi:hypothetical protein
VLPMCPVQSVTHVSGRSNREPGVPGRPRPPTPGHLAKRENMTVAEEKALLARFAKAAGAGEMLNIHDLKRAYEQQIGHKTSSSTVYDLLGQQSCCR